ncbi:MAG: SpoIIE family protein phosphatase [Actinomycetota bacterium]|nr:SpoIIE family protein phosphatase [Actinomycetota bacterium]
MAPDIDTERPAATAAAVDDTGADPRRPVGPGSDPAGEHVSGDVRAPTFRRRMRRAFTAYVITLSVATVAVVAVMIRLTYTAGDVDRLRDGSLRATELRTQSLRMTVALQGWVVTGEPDRLGTLAEARALAMARQATLVALAEEEASFRNEVRTVVDASEAYWSDIIGEQIDAAEAGVDPATIVRDLRAETREEGLGTAMRALEERLAVERDVLDEQSRRWRAALALTFAGVVAAVVTISLVAARSVQRSFVQPLERLRGSVARVADGELDSTVTVEGPEELTELAAQIDDMRVRIVEQLQELRESTTVTTQVASALGGSTELPPGWSASARLVPAEGQLAGDCYGVEPLSATRFGVALVDIAGHGAEVAVTALRAKEFLLASMRRASPGVAIGALADGLTLEQGLFLTCVAVQIDTADGTCLYAGAGHPPPVLVAPDGRVRRLDPTGPLVGPFESTWSTERTPIVPGATLVCFSDGLTEGRLPDGDLFGEDRLVDTIRAHRDLRPEEMIDAILRAQSAHGVAVGRDDMTLTVIRRA